MAKRDGEKARNPLAPASRLWQVPDFREECRKVARTERDKCNKIIPSTPGRASAKVVAGKGTYKLEANRVEA